MPALAELHELSGTKSQLEAMRLTNPSFYTEVVMLFLAANRKYVKSGYVCKTMMGVEVEDRYLPHNIQSKRSIDDAIWSIRLNYVWEFRRFCSFLHDNRKVGYNNIVSLLLGETPQGLKGYGRDCG
jgi:hypothetical protein